MNATAPSAAPSQLQSSPQARVVGQGRVGGKIISRLARGEDSRSFYRTEVPAVFADEINSAFHALAINDNPDTIAIAQFSNGPAGQRFRSHVSYARAGRDARKPRISDERNVFAEGQMLERGGQLISFFHARS